MCVVAQVRTNAVKWAWSVYRRSLPNQTAHMKASSVVGGIKSAHSARHASGSGNVAYLLT